jgi:hypothetical protein
LEQFVNRNAQTQSQLMQRAGMWMGGTAGQTAERSFVELGGGDHLLKRKVVASHNPAQIPGHSRGVAVDGRCHT